MIVKVSRFQLFQSFLQLLYGFNHTASLTLRFMILTARTEERISYTLNIDAQNTDRDNCNSNELVGTNR